MHVTYINSENRYVTLDQTIAAFSKLQCLLNEGTKEPENVPFQKRITALEREFKGKRVIRVYFCFL